MLTRSPQTALSKPGLATRSLSRVRSRNISRRRMPSVIIATVCMTMASSLFIFKFYRDASVNLKSHLDKLQLSHLPPVIQSFARSTANEDGAMSKSLKGFDLAFSKMEDLKSLSFPHGTFFFGPTSHQTNPTKTETIDPSQSWTPIQRQLLDDSAINITLEKERCASYNFQFPDTPNPKRRRLFLGALIANDSFEAIKASGMEGFDLFHSVAFIESNTTQSHYSRKWRFFGSNEEASKNLALIHRLFGPQTKVSVDYYTTSVQKGEVDTLTMEAFQREGIAHRWKMNGMMREDVAILTDVDEFLSRDFLRALQICDVPQLRSGQDCKKPKLIGSTLVFEGSPECSWKGRRWYHPDVMLGECVDQIGDTKVHPQTKRSHWELHGSRLDGYGHDGDYSKYESDVLVPLNMKNSYPLWTPEEIRSEPGGDMISKNDGAATGFHLHNFFMSGEEVRFKYLTYGHPHGEALTHSLRDIHGSGDLMLAVKCAYGDLNDEAEQSFERIPSSVKPIYYLNPEVRQARHSLWQDIVRKDEEKFPQKVDDTASVAVEEKIDAMPKSQPTVPKSSTHWDSAKSAVLGVASGYDRSTYEVFVGSLRATGFSGHIILGVAKNIPADALSYLMEQNVTIKVVEQAEKCTYNGTIGEKGVPIDMQRSGEWHCPKDYPDYKITWARFLYYRDWLNDCPSCTDGVILTDVRDAFFQRDPFVTAVERSQTHPLMVFQEVFPVLDNTNWLTDWPVDACRKYKLGATPMLCSGSIMGSREGILDYIDVMEEEFKYWMQRENCRIDNRGDDQSIHNYLFYAGQLKNAVSIPHRQGPIHVVGYTAARIFENATKEAEDAGVGVHEIYTRGRNWTEWLHPKYGLINPNTGIIVNEDGTPSAQVHQVDRFGPLINNWENEMIRQGWPYNKGDIRQWKP